MGVDRGQTPESARIELDFAAFFDVSLDMLCVRDREGRFVKVNQAWTTTLGYPTAELEGVYLLSLIHPDDLGATLVEMRRVRTEGEGIPRFINRYRHRDGSYRHLEWRARQVGDFVFAVARDVSDRIAGDKERARLAAELDARQERLRQSQKMAALGRLTGGVAHDFNNLLTVIIGSTEELTAALPDAPELQALGRVSLEAAERGAELISRLLAYTRKQPLVFEAVDCNRILGSLEHLVRSTFPEDIDLRLEPAPEALFCLADTTQLTTALLNLCLNARDAMPGGGRLTVRVGVDFLSPEEWPRGGAAGSFVRFTVADTGQGMSMETRARAAEPFFTTKGAGAGSGLGLSMVDGFVSQCGGKLAIDSESGAGARISIWLPQAQRNPATAAHDPTDLPAAPRDARILVVEDDPLIRSQAERQLRAMGYAVATAPDGVEALKVLAASPPFDLLLTDVVMPNGLSGCDLAARAQTINPAMQVLLSSGHSEETVLDGAGKQIGVAFLPKPYRRAELERKVAQLLVRGSALGRGPA